jgi:hypothetical protein
MAKFIRYALAYVCFAASVGCLALWCWNVARRELDNARFSVASTTFTVDVCEGIAAVRSEVALPSDRFGQARSYTITDIAPFANIMRQQGRFGTIGPAFFFPLWYPALIFALAGVASLRFGRRFTIRSAIIATTVVAGLLGMVVTL